jgi:hypothetical protein
MISNVKKPIALASALLISLLVLNIDTRAPLGYSSLGIPSALAQSCGVDGDIDSPLSSLTQTTAVAASSLRMLITSRTSCGAAQCDSRKDPASTPWRIHISMDPSAKTPTDEEKILLRETHAVFGGSWEYMAPKGQCLDTSRVLNCLSTNMLSLQSQVVSWLQSTNLAQKAEEARKNSSKYAGARVAMRSSVTECLKKDGGSALKPCPSCNPPSCPPTGDPSFDCLKARSACSLISRSECPSGGCAQDPVFQGLQTELNKCRANCRQTVDAPACNCGPGTGVNAPTGGNQPPEAQGCQCGYTIINPRCAQGSDCKPLVRCIACESESNNGGGSGSGAGNGSGNGGNSSPQQGCKCGSVFTPSFGCQPVAGRTCPPIERCLQCAADDLPLCPCTGVATGQSSCRPNPKCGLVPQTGVTGPSNPPGASSPKPGDN